MPASSLYLRVDPWQSFSLLEFILQDAMVSMYVQSKCSYVQICVKDSLMKGFGSSSVPLLSFLTQSHIGDDLVLRMVFGATTFNPRTADTREVREHSRTQTMSVPPSGSQRCDCPLHVYTLLRPVYLHTIFKSSNVRRRWTISFITHFHTTHRTRCQDRRDNRSICGGPVSHHQAGHATFHIRSRLGMK